MTQTPQDPDYQDQDAEPTNMAPDGDRPSGPSDELLEGASDDEGHDNALDDLPQPPG